MQCRALLQLSVHRLIPLVMITWPKFPPRSTWLLMVGVLYECFSPGRSIDIGACAQVRQEEAGGLLDSGERSWVSQSYAMGPGHGVFHVGHSVPGLLVPRCPTRNSLHIETQHVFQEATQIHHSFTLRSLKPKGPQHCMGN